MARLPRLGSDVDNWGDVLNEYLLTSHTSDGTLKANAVGTQALADGTVTQSKLSSGLQAKVNAAGAVASVAGKTGAVTLVKEDIGLGRVNNVKITVAATAPSSPSVGDVWIVTKAA